MIAADDVQFSKIIANLCRHLKERGLQAHTKIKGGSLIVIPRRPRKSRLTGEAR